MGIDEREPDHGIDSFTHQAADPFGISRATSSPPPGDADA